MGPGIVVGGLSWAAGLLVWAVTGSVIGGILGALGFCAGLVWGWARACDGD